MLDAVDQLVPQATGGPDGGARGEILRHKGAEQAEHGHADHQSEAREHIAPVMAVDTDVDDLRHDQRNDEVEARLEHFEERCKERLEPEFFQIGQQMPHGISSLLMSSKLL